MTDYNDGEWHNIDGPYPGGVHLKSLVTHVWHDEEMGCCGIEYDMPAGMVAWSHVLKFRVTEPSTEPRVIWVNEYPNGRCGAHFTEDKARQAACAAATRVAVRYVEAPE